MKILLYFIKNNQHIIFNISAKSFLHSQVRIMVGTLIDIGKGIIKKSLLEIIESKKDPRNYKVSFEKIKKNLDFSPQFSVKDSISQILYEINENDLDPRDSEFSNISKMTEQVKIFSDYNFDENL